ncbi:acetate--CoA ligase [Acetobacter aceti]|uniref:Acetate--CoA ligase n=1 Tax=Acetobacter aceti TaxID=435 RepID=A0A6S6PJ00_ACEAC|nr:acetate--CoA ligase [Acetobacter aceti]BCI66950.1 acetyl-coenzyme A synthetase [Acetobacter aceti]
MSTPQTDLAIWDIESVDPAKALQIRAMREQVQADPETFWLEQAKRLEWERFPSVGNRSTFEDEVSIRWYEDGKLNVSVNCLDRHLKERGDQTALIWQGNDPGVSRQLTFRELHAEVCRVANALKSLGVKHGDRVAIHLPMTVEVVACMLACARIGAVHVVLFGGFSPEGIGERLIDSGAVAVITCDAAKRGAKTIPHKAVIDAALRHTGSIGSVKNVIVVNVSDTSAPMTAGRDHDYAELVAGQSDICEPEIMNAEDVFFLLYTSGSTGKPKAIVHTTGGYLVWAAYTVDVTFPAERGTTHWCTADVAWITGHTFVVYGPLANGTTTLLFEGLMGWPQVGRWWDIIDRFNVSSFFTAPTAIRALMRDGDDLPRQYSLTSLRRLGSAGEPISPDAWLWYYEVIGQKKCPVIDMWWQTETAGPMLSAIAGAQKLKPGWATTGIPGIFPSLTNEKGEIIENREAEGCLCFDESWPGQTRSIWGDHKRFRETYFTFSTGRYFSGDGARRDADGNLMITGRMDDVINVSGHRIGTAEIEDAVATDHSVAEAAAVGINHDLKGQGIVVFVVARNTKTLPSEAHLSKVICERVGRYAAPEKVYLVSELPKTRSGKIVRRLLRKIASNETDSLGDLSSLADTSVVPALIALVQKQLLIA